MKSFIFGSGIFAVHRNTSELARKSVIRVSVFCTLPTGRANISIIKSKMEAKQSNRPPPADEIVELWGKKFPRSIVRNHTDISFGEELGGGQFGTVFKGFLHLSELQR